MDRSSPTEAACGWGAATDTVWLITSGAFVCQELAAEFGLLPPAFLPVGTRRLYEYQIERIGPARAVYLTLPETFDIPAEDARILAQAGVVTLAVPEGLSLGESVICALNLIGVPAQPLHILHGDTLVDDLPDIAPDWVGTAPAAARYSWAEVERDGDRIVGLETVAAGTASGSARPVACGLFSFSQSATLVRGLTRARGDFIGGILDYARHCPLRAVELSAWHDFGHVQTYFRSRRLVTSARHFNILHIDGKTVRKAGADNDKIRAEAAWFEAAPPSLRIYCARLIDKGEDAAGRAFYETEYGYLPTLAELFVFGRIGRAAWLLMLECCRDFLQACAIISDGRFGGDALRELAATKTMARLDQFAAQSGFDVTAMLRYGDRPMPSLMQIAQDVIEHIDVRTQRPACVMHGDFCFSNILFDSRVGRIHVIDPRGCVHPGQPTVFGDTRYDLAKLSHSVVGRYDQIIAGRYHLDCREGRRFHLEFERSAHHTWLEHALDEFEVGGIRAGGREIRALTIGLFLSMLPLHSDRPDRQHAFIANALRLYADLEALGA